MIERPLSSLAIRTIKMNSQVSVFKFGGASVKDAESVKNVANILQQHKDKSLIIIVSAMGKSTDKLEKVAKAYIQQNGKANDLFEEFKRWHFEIISQLFETGDPVFDEVNDMFVAVEWTLEEEPYPNNDFIYDQIVSNGELVSTRIIAAYLNKVGLTTQWLDARDVILTDDIYREGWVQWEQTIENAQAIVKPMLENSPFVLTQGFIGSTTENFTTTLGREGSDYSAAIFSYCMDAKDMSIWKDVPGVLTADPRLFENVAKLDRLSYKEAIEMTYYGAKVIHPKTIKPLQNKSIPLYVKSFLEPESEGTFIGPDVDDNYPPMIAVEKNQALLNISTRDFSFVAEHHISFIFNKIAEYRLHVNLMQNTAISFVLCMSNVDDKVNQFAKSIEKDFKVTIDNHGLELLTVRHYMPQTLAMMREGKIVLVEERSKNTVQLVAKEVPRMKRKG